ncbi:MAG TPA: hypothetical protein VF483_08985 [Gemmatimonadaceae bacterium]
MANNVVLSSHIALGLMVVSALACAPRVRPATGVVVKRSLPATALARGHRLIVFRWTLEDADIFSRGEGAVRQAGPDSARLDFFLGGGLGTGSAVLIGNEVRLASDADRMTRRLVPAAPLLWAVLGRAAPPASSDTVFHVDGDTLRVDIGNPMSWRLTFEREMLRRVERVSGARVVEWVSRAADGRVRYRNELSRRQLDVMVTRNEGTRIDADSWTLP